MPIFEYQCEACERRFDELIRNSADEAWVACPACGSPDVLRQVSAPSIGGTSSSDGTGRASSSGCSPHGGFS